MKPGEHLDDMPDLTVVEPGGVAAPVLGVPGFVRWLDQRYALATPPVVSPGPEPLMRQLIAYCDDANTPQSVLSTALRSVLAELVEEAEVADRAHGTAHRSPMSQGYAAGKVEMANRALRRAAEYLRDLPEPAAVDEPVPTVDDPGARMDLPDAALSAAAAARVARTPLPEQDDSPEALHTAVVSLRRELEKAQRELEKAQRAERMARAGSELAVRQRDEAQAKVKKLRGQRDRARACIVDLETQVDDLNAIAEYDDTLWSKSHKEYSVELPGLQLPPESRDDAYARASRAPNACVVSRRVTAWEPDTADGPASPLSGPQDVQEPTAGHVGTPDGPGRAQAVLRVVEAARAWRLATRHDAPPSARGGSPYADLIKAVDALGDHATLSSDILRESYLVGWARGVRWAADEADAQARARPDTRYTGTAIGDILDLTDHLRACADDPKRNTFVPRTDAERF